MYLVSVYFDEKTNKRILQYMNKVAEVTGNSYMIENQVPPHMTISAFETRDEEHAIKVMDKLSGELKKGMLQWVAVGQFFPYVMYVAPVLNGYLQDMATRIYEAFANEGGVQMSPYYRPYQWVPHVTIGKKLSREEMQKAFGVMQEYFSVFEGEVGKIGLARPNPHRDIVSYELQEKPLGKMKPRGLFLDSVYDDSHTSRCPD
jgi:2'-5' RNA ligase